MWRLPLAKVEHWVYSALLYWGFHSQPFWLIFHWIGIVKWELSRAGVVIGHWLLLVRTQFPLSLSRSTHPPPLPIISCMYVVVVPTHIPQTLSANDDAVGQWVKLWITLFTDYNHNAGKQRCRHNIGHTRSPIMRIQPHTNELFRWALSKQLPTARRADSFSHFPGVREEFPSLVCRGCSVGGAGGKRGVSVAREVITPSRHADHPGWSATGCSEAWQNNWQNILEDWLKRPMPLPITWSHNTVSRQTDPRPTHSPHLFCILT